MLVRILCIMIGYCFGLIQTSYIYGRINHIDIRQHGSGNAGTTNALRVLGKKAGAVVFIGDIAKSLAACIVVHLIFGRYDSEIIRMLALYAGLGVVLGHSYPFYLKFHGGKGIAAMAGILIGMDWRLTLCCLAAFIIVVAVTRYVSLGSLCVVTIFFAGAVFFGNRGDYGSMGGRLYEFYGVAFVLMAICYITHRANIARLLKGTENKLGRRK